MAAIPLSFRASVHEYYEKWTNSANVAPAAAGGTDISPLQNSVQRRELLHGDRRRRPREVPFADLADRPERRRDLRRPDLVRGRVVLRVEVRLLPGRER
jgi:hypothetical protein